MARPGNVFGNKEKVTARLIFRKDLTITCFSLTILFLQVRGKFMVGRGSIPQKDVKILCARSGNKCALSDCRMDLVENKTDSDKEVFLGVIAHIKGEREGAARFDSRLSEKERNSYPNLILVCPRCHKIIDDQPQTYTVDKLLRLKLEHEEYIDEQLKEEVANVTFAEVDQITKYLSSPRTETGTSYTIIPPKDKLEKNRLSNKIEQLVRMGMTRADQVEKFINANADIEFGVRLKQGFVREYERLKNEEGLDGDDLFEALLHFASGKSSDKKIWAAGIVVLTYLFEKCEVFEK